jgi:hypothetical protein
MLFNLNVIDTAYSPLDVTNSLIYSESINIFDNGVDTPLADTITLPVPLQAGNTYDIVFPAGGANVYSGTTVMTSLDDGTINEAISNAVLTSGGTISITPDSNITTLNFAAISVTPFADTFNITNIINIGGLVTVTTDRPHGLAVAQNTTIAGTTVENGTFAVANIIDEFTFDFDDVASAPGDSDTNGTATGFNVEAYYNETVQVRGEDITITIDWGVGSQVFTGTNVVSGLVIPDNSTVEITVESGGLYTYNNIIQAYTNEVFASALMQPIITDPIDQNYRRPYPNFFTVLEPCSFNVHVYDGQNAPFGVINYYLGDENGELLSSGQRNYILNTCVQDIVAIGQEIVVREIANCGGTSPILWDRFTSPDFPPFNGNPPYSWFEIQGIQTLNFLPEFQLDNEFRCCTPINEEITVAPELLEMNNDEPPHDLVCDVTADPNVVLNYSLLTPSQTIVDLGSYTAAEIDAGPLAALNATFTPDELGTYTLTVTLTNCCGTITEVYEIGICDSWQITNTDCNEVVITNLSGSSTLTYTLRELTENDIFEVMTINGVLQENIDVLPNTTEELDLVKDNIYVFDLVTDNPGDTPVERIFLLDCNIKKCKKEFLLAVTCPPEKCDELAKIELWKNYVHFKTLEEIVYYRWDEWLRQQSVFPSFSINDIMEEVLSVKDVITQLEKLCNICGIKEEDCGCS